MSIHNTEMQIQIDDVYACPGHCPGCALSSIERKGYEPDVSLDTLHLIYDKLNDYLKEINNYDRIGITYGIADHFLMNDDYLAKTFLLGSQLIKNSQIENTYNSIYYTSSMIGKHEKIINKVKLLNDLSKQENVQFAIIAVLDPKNLLHPKFSELYTQNIIESNKIIGNNLDLAINLSVEAMQSISPKDLYEFALKNNFKEVTINWTPTFDNLSFSYQNQKEMSTWLIEFDQLLLKDTRIGTSYLPTIIKNMLRLQSQQNDSLLEVIQNNLKETILKTIQIDHLGNIYPRFEAIGDIWQTQRFNFAPLGNIKDDSIFNIINNNFHQTKKHILNSLMKTPCNDCEYNKYCATSGFHIYNKVLHTNQKDINTAQRINANIKENNCLHIAKRLFQHYEKQLFNFNND